jgi:hypothetical protein
VALERLDAFAFDAAGDRGGSAEPDAAADGWPETAREMVLRALRAASDPVNDRIMRLLDGGAVGIRELAGELGLPRPAVWERAGDLVQVGLAERSLEGDRVALTAAGRGMLDLVAELGTAAREASGR